MPEIADFTDARQRLAALYEVPARATLLDDYARIAEFLCDAGRFEAALTKVSEFLWSIYCDLGKETRNRFTTAIALLGRQYGFMYDESNRCATNVVVLLGAVDGAQYLQWVKSGVFFKDDMDAKHGEHSHTLQWLAVAVARERLGLQIHSSANFLYRSIYNVKPLHGQSVIVPGFKLQQKSNAQAARGGVSLWSWLVDCFPVSMATGQTLPNTESLFSNTYRCPQYLMEYLFNRAGDEHFVATYLRYRYLRRRWIPEYSSKYSGISGGATSKTYMSTKLDKASQSSDSRLKPIPGVDGKTSAFTKDTRDSKVVVKQAAEDGDIGSRDKRKYWEMSFHGKKGQLRDPTQYT
jgi:Family of unknown function (DUF5636)